MAKIKIDVHPALRGLPPQEIKFLIKTSFYDSARKRLLQLKKEAREAKEKITFYEKKYGCSFRELDSKGLPNDAGSDEHDDYLDWFFWEQNYQRNQELIQQYYTLLEFKDENKRGP